MAGYSGKPYLGKPYSGKPVVENLGIKPGFCIYAIGAPAAYDDIVGKLPLKFVIPTRLRAKNKRTI
jgi:hypothetical protein